MTQQNLNSSKTKMLLVLATLVALFLAPAASQESRVTVGFYGESLCPDCINFINGPLTHAFKEVCWCSLIRINRFHLYLPQKFNYL